MYRSKEWSHFWSVFLWLLVKLTYFMFVSYQYCLYMIWSVHPLWSPALALFYYLKDLYSFSHAKHISGVPKKKKGYRTCTHCLLLVNILSTTILIQFFPFLKYGYIFWVHSVCLLPIILVIFYFYFLPK